LTRSVTVKVVPLETSRLGFGANDGVADGSGDAQPAIKRQSSTEASGFMADERMLVPHRVRKDWAMFSSGLGAG